MKYLLVLHIVFVSIFSFAQQPNWKINPIDLPENISSLNMDTLGFLWFSAESSFYRFNGLELEQKFTFPGEEISSVNQKGGLFYLGTSLGRVVLINPYKSNYAEIYACKEQWSISDIFIYDEKNFILLSYGNGVRMHLNGKEDTLTVENGLLSNEVYEIEEFNDAIYISSDQGIQTLTFDADNYNLSKIEKEDGLSDLVITRLLKIENKLWYSDYDSNVGSIDENGTIENYPLVIRDEIKDIISHKGQLFLLNDSGIYCLSGSEWVQKYSKQENVSGEFFQIDEEDNLWQIDSRNNLWVGNLRFQKIDLDIKDIRAIAKYGSKFFIGNEDGLFVYTDGVKKQINDRNITYLLTYNNHILVGTFSNGLMIYDGNHRLIDQIDNWSGIPKESILTIYENKGFIYVSSLSGVFKMKFENQRLKPIQSLNLIIGQTYVYSILADNEYMYFGSDRNGLVRWNMASDKIEKIDRFNSGHKIGSVYSMTFDENENLWFTSTERGIGKISNDKIEYFDQIGNLNDEFTSITNLKDGTLLLIRSSNLGLLQTDVNHFMYFDKELGLKEETAFLNTTTQDSTNTYFINGNSIYSYASLEDFKIHPEVIIDQVIVNLSVTENQYEFTEDENNIAIKYKGSWLTDPTKLSYQFKLEGFDDTWRETKDDQVAFPKLMPGKYNFRVRAAENGIFSDEPEANFAFEIKRHFYNLWYFRLFLAALLVIGFLRWRKLYEQRKEEKLKFEKTIVDNQLINLKSQLNPHFLFNAFNTLIALIEQDQDRSIAFVEKMTMFYREMLELGKDSMVNLGREKYMLEQYIGILRVRFSSQIEFLMQFDEPENYEIPPMTLQLLVENAIKHNVVSKKKPLRIKIVQTGNDLKVWNNRNELINNAPGTHTGLSNIKKRFQLANLDIPIVNSTDEFFEVNIKLKRL